MSNIHLDENTIQQYAITGVLDGEEQTQHFLHCNHCREKAAAYTQLLAGIKDQPAPAFDFDLAALVMQKIPAKKAAIPWQPVLIIAGLLCIISLVTYNLRTVFGTVFKGLSSMAASLIFIAVISVLLFQLADMVNKHRQQINALV
jgi:hypothetical protein